MGIMNFCWRCSDCGRFGKYPKFELNMVNALSTPYGRHLAQDPRWAAILNSHPPLSVGFQDQLFFRLCRSILGQQLSVKVAEVITERFLEYFGGQPPEPVPLLEAEPMDLRSLGISQAKIKYLKAWARYALDTGFEDSFLHSLRDDQVRQYLLPVPGVGPWTVDMLLIFSLGREDIWPVGDLGVRLSAQSTLNFHGPGGAAGRKALFLLAEDWKPYRSYAALHLWHHRDRMTAAGKSTLSKSSSQDVKASKKEAVSKV